MIPPGTPGPWPDDGLRGVSGCQGSAVPGPTDSAGGGAQERTVAGMTNHKIALVTGANRGIGKEIARQLGEFGHQVLIGARSEEKGRAAAAELAAAGLTAAAVRLDVTDADSIRAAAELIEREHGRLDLLVNNAAIIAEGDDGVAEVSADVLRRSYETNVIGLVTVTGALLPLLRKSAAARIVNLSSGLGSLTLVGDPGNDLSRMRLAGYNSSKAAVNMVTVMLANELRGTGILVNLADPGNCATQMGGLDAARSPAQGAAVAVRLATLADSRATTTSGGRDRAGDGPTGQFHDEDGRLPW